MKKILLLLGVLLLFWSITIVHDGQFAVVTNRIQKTSHILYPGIHIAYPIIDTVSIIPSGANTAKIIYNNLPLYSNMSATVTVLFDTKIVDPLQYYQAIHTQGIKTIESALGEQVKAIVLNRAHLTNLSTFNQLDVIFSGTIATYGMVITKITISNINLNTYQARESQSSIDPVINLVNGYYKAHNLKLETDLECSQLIESVAATITHN